MKYQGVEILWDLPPPPEPDFIVVSPWVIKAMKRIDKKFSRRDKRRKHKRHAPWIKRLTTQKPASTT